MVAAHPAVDVEIKGGEKAVGLAPELDFDPGGIVLVVEEGDLGSYEGDRSLVESTVEDTVRSFATFLRARFLK